MKSDDEKDIDWETLRLQVMGHPSAKAAPTTRGGVGYGKPPKSGQFQKGRSGNPNGRPVKVVSFGTLARDIADIARRKIKANRGDGAQEISMQRAVLEKTIEIALKGNAMAQREAFKQFQMAEAAEEAHRAQIVAEWRAYQGEGWRRIRKAQDAGKPEPLLIPHPDDITIDDKAGVSFDGPKTIEEHVDCEIGIKARDAYILQDAVDRRSGAVPRYPQTKGEVGFAFCQAITFDRMLPGRLQLGTKIEDHIKAHNKGCKRALLKSHRAAFAELGIPIKRGATTFRMKEAAPNLKIVTRHLKEITADEPVEQIVQRLQNMCEEAGVKFKKE